MLFSRFCFLLNEYLSTSETFFNTTVAFMINRIFKIIIFCFRFITIYSTIYSFSQTEEQYIFIHDALLEAVTCGETEVLVRNLPIHIQQLSQMDPGTTVTGMELEFKVNLFRLQHKLRCPTVDSSDRIGLQLPSPLEMLFYLFLFFFVFHTEIRIGKKRILSVRKRQPARE